MADSPSFRRHPLPFSVDLVRWLPSSASSGRHLAAAVHDPSVPASSRLSLLPLHDPASPLASLPLPSRPTALRCSPSVLAATTSSGSLHLLPSSFDTGSAVSVPGGAGFHVGPVRGLDCGGEGWVTAGEDGRVHVVSDGGDGRVVARRVWDGKGMSGYEAARWASSAEFATGGAGCGVQWWDRRKGDAVVAQCKGVWGRGVATGMVHSIDIHPSRKHVCVVGGSSGTIFAWDLRCAQQPIPLSGVGLDETVQPVCESEVWEVLFDNYTQSSDIISSVSTRILPVMLCSEDGILAIVEQDERPLELLAEPCAINSFDIDPQNPSDVVCALEWESIGVLTRGRDAMAEE
ncbi:nuclear pore complex protein NUP43-like [Triticum dicoccoides]|uniref:nuclear pore complex protein NUP43-like n=1 Tax=Triticum dicoccoides TaxID=85692 RepID=UPI000E7A0763|nr:nuclear pore complex protein NUP43-like [Triticum dicoccoides]